MNGIPSIGRLIETWDVLKLNDEYPDNWFLLGLIETWDVLKRDKCDRNTIHGID